MPRATRNSQRVASGQALTAITNVPKLNETRKAVAAKASVPAPVLAKPRKLKGQLKQLIHQIPLDVLYEIFALLHPRDLLSLSRSAKTFRQNLFRKSSAWIWKAASVRAGLPSTPEGMTEPTYASFMFDHFCMVCLGPRATFVSLQATIRHCKRCTSTLFVPYHKVFDELLEARDEWLGEYETLADDEVFLRSVLPHCEDPTKKKESWYHKATCDRLSEEFKAANGRLAVMKILTRCLNNAVKNYDRSASNSAYLTEMVEDQTREKEEIRMKRKEAIVAKLSESGYMDEIPLIQNTEEFLEHPDVDQSKLLTERTWKNMKPRLMRLIDDLRVDRLNEERSSAIKSRYALVNDLLKGFVDKYPNVLKKRPATMHLLKLEPFKSIVVDTPFNVTLEPSALREAFSLETFPILVNDWMDDREAGLLRLLQASSPNAKVSELNLAKTVFQCSGCKDYGPRGITSYHGCRTRRMNEKFQQLVWPIPPPVSIPAKACLSAARILQQCKGLNPKTTKQDDIASILDVNPLNVKKTYFECLSCQSDNGRLVMEWFEAVRHDSIHPDGGEWVQLRGLDLFSARMAELLDHITNDEVIYSCRHCVWNMPLYGFPDHLLIHDIQSDFNLYPKSRDVILVPDQCGERPFKPRTMTVDEVEKRRTIYDSFKSQGILK